MRSTLSSKDDGVADLDTKMDAVTTADDQNISNVSDAVDFTVSNPLRFIPSGHD